MHQIGAARNLFYLCLGAVAPHVRFMQHFVEVCILVDAGDDVLEDLLLVL
jgi:hypothetical protein